MLNLVLYSTGFNPYYRIQLPLSFPPIYRNKQKELEVKQYVFCVILHLHPIKKCSISHNFSKLKIVSRGEFLALYAFSI